MRDRRTLVAAVAAAGILLVATSFPLLAFRPAEEPKPQQQPAPPQPPPPRPGFPTSQDGARFFFDRDAAGQNTLDGTRYYYPLATRSVFVTLDVRF